MKRVGRFSTLVATAALLAIALPFSAAHAGTECSGQFTGDISAHCTLYSGGGRLTIEGSVYASEAVQIYVYVKSRDVTSVVQKAELSGVLLGCSGSDNSGAASCHESMGPEGLSLPSGSVGPYSGALDCYVDSDQVALFGYFRCRSGS